MAKNIMDAIGFSEHYLEDHSGISEPAIISSVSKVIGVNIANFECSEMIYKIVEDEFGDDKMLMIQLKQPKIYPKMR